MICRIPIVVDCLGEVSYVLYSFELSQHHNITYSYFESACHLEINCEKRYFNSNYEISLIIQYSILSPHQHGSGKVIIMFECHTCWPMSPRIWPQGSDLHQANLILANNMRDNQGSWYPGACSQAIRLSLDCSDLQTWMEMATKYYTTIRQKIQHQWEFQVNCQYILETGTGGILINARDKDGRESTFQG